MYSNKGHKGVARASTNVPAGKLKTPAPTIDLTRLNTSSGMVAVPVPLPSSELPSEPAAATLRAVLAARPAPAVAGDEGGALAPPLARILATPVALPAGLWRWKADADCSCGRTHAADATKRTLDLLKRMMC